MLLDRVLSGISLSLMHSYVLISARGLDKLTDLIRCCLLHPTPQRVAFSIAPSSPPCMQSAPRLQAEDSPTNMPSLSNTFSRTTTQATLCFSGNKHLMVDRKHVWRCPLLSIHTVCGDEERRTPQPDC